MANRYLVANGNTSLGATWDGGTLPSSSDNLFSNGFVGVVDANITALSFNNTASSPSVAGGGWQLNNGITAVSTSECRAGAAALFRVTAGAHGYVVYPTCQCQLINESGYAASSTGGTLTVTGTAICNNGGQNGAAYLLLSGIMNVTGSITSSTNNHFADFAGAGTMNFVGTLNQGTGRGFWLRANNFILNMTADIVGGTNGTYSLAPAATFTGTINHYGSVKAGTLLPAVTGSAIVYSGTGPFINEGDIQALAVNKMRLISSVGSYWAFGTSTPLEQKRFYAADTLTGYPAEAKVEDGTVYGPSSEFEGTLEPWDATFAQALATAQRDLQLPSILSAITAP